MKLSQRVQALLGTLHSLEPFIQYLDNGRKIEGEQVDTLGDLMSDLEEETKSFVEDMDNHPNINWG